jgi:hypothetical protein
VNQPGGSLAPARHIGGWWSPHVARLNSTAHDDMIAHHRMGVMMASHAAWNTQHPELRQLQAVMVRVQSQEIEQMAQWYQKWYGTGAL